VTSRRHRLPVLDPGPDRARRPRPTVVDDHRPDAVATASIARRSSSGPPPSPSPHRFTIGPNGPLGAGGVTRSKLYADALERMLQEEDDDAITTRIDEVCRDLDTSMDPAWKEAQRRALAHGGDW
jgi:hypothetical protein